MNDFPNTRQVTGSKTCGPVCLLNIYDHFGKSVPLSQILQELHVEDSESTYTPQLAKNCIVHGLETVMLTSNSFSVAPNWKGKTKEEIIVLLKTWVTQNAGDAWLKETLFLLFYLEAGGNLDIVDLSTAIVDDYLDKGYILLAALEESWLWEKRKLEGKAEYDDIKGHTRGHFVVVYGKEGDEYLVSDPYSTTIPNREGLYKISKQKLFIATLIWSHEFLAIKNG